LAGKKNIKAPASIPVPVVSDDKTPMYSPEGEFVSVPSSELGTFQNLGYQMDTLLLRGQLAEKAKFGEGIGNELAAGGLGALRGTTLGLSDLGIRHAEKMGVLPKGSIEHVQKLKEYNPDASLAGEIGSFALPIAGAYGLAGKTGSALLRGAGAGQAAVSAVGEGVGKVAAKIVGERLGTIAAGGARFATEAAAYQIAHNVSEEALKDVDLTAESILSHVGQSAILGAGLGVALPVFARVAKPVVDVGKELGGKVVDSALKQFEQFFDPDRSLQLYSGAMGRGALLKDTVQGNKFRNAVSALKDKRFYDSGEVQVALKDGAVTFEKVAKGALPSSDEAYARLLKAQEDVMNMRKNTLGLADDFIRQTPELQAKLATFPAAAETSILAKIDKMASNGITQDVVGLRGTVADIKSLFEAKQGSLAGLEELKEGLYQRIKERNFQSLGSPDVQILKDLARTVKASIETGAEVVSKQPGMAGKIAPVKALNETYAQLEAIREPLDTLIQKGTANVNVGRLRFRDIGIGAIGAGVLGPAGALLAPLNKIAQTDKGLLMRASLGERLESLGWSQGIVDKTMDKMAGNVRAFISKTKERTGKVAENIAADTVSVRRGPAERIGENQQWFKNTRKAIMGATANIDAVMDQVDHQTKGLREAPEVRDAVAMKQMQILGYLADKMPKDPSTPLNPFGDPWKPSEGQINEYKLIVKVAREPMSVFADMKRGTLKKVQVETLRDLYPKMYERVLQQVSTEVISKGGTLPYSHRVQMSQLFGVPLDNTMRPEFVKRMQQFSQQEEKDQNPQMGSGKATGFGGRNESATERTVNRGN
jgi:hypothetical protein